MKWFALGCRLVLAAVFIGAAVLKILHPHDFALAVFRYQMLPYPWVNLAALTLPWIELLSGLALLLVPRLRDAAAAIILALLLVFTTAIAVNLARGVSIACGCFSVDPAAEKMGYWNLVRNAALILMAAWTWRRAARAGGRGVTAPG